LNRISRETLLQRLYEDNTRSNAYYAKEFGCNRKTIRLWRVKFANEGLINYAPRRRSQTRQQKEDADAVDLFLTCLYGAVVFLRESMEGDARADKYKKILAAWLAKSDTLLRSQSAINTQKKVR
jgi:hypothetical protein